MDSTSPKFENVATLAKVALALEEPRAVLLENGPAFSVLISNRVCSNPGEHSVVFEDCVQFRIEPSNRRYIRNFSEVKIYQDSQTQLYMATPDDGDTFFSQPSKDPYALIELSFEEANFLVGAIEVDEHDCVFSLLCQRFGQLQGFYAPSEDELRAGDDYACARGEFKESEVEFI